MATNVEVGTRLGQYEVIGVLGAGGAGSVFRPKDVETGDEVAIKTLMPCTVVNEEIHKRFRKFVNTDENESNIEFVDE